MAKFINPSLIVAQTGLGPGQVVADLGCGSGFYVLPSAQLVGNSGLVYAVDVVEAKLAATASIANQFGYKNIKFVHADLSKPLTTVPEGSCDLVILGNILHQVSDQKQLMKNVYRLLKTGGQVLIVEWKKGMTPLGPQIDKRIDPQVLEMLTLDNGLKRLKVLDADLYHYAEMFTK